MLIHPPALSLINPTWLAYHLQTLLLRSLKQERYVSLPLASAYLREPSAKFLQGSINQPSLKQAVAQHHKSAIQLTGQLFI